MASLYQQPKSPFWWIKYRARNGSIKRESTGFRIGKGMDFRRAKDLVAERSHAERNHATVHKLERWEFWARDYIFSETRGRTQERYLSAWRSVSRFFEIKEVPSPRFLTYALCAEYLPWRTAAKNLPEGIRRAGRNTAILEIKFIRWLMREAVRRAFAAGNPARELVLRRDPRKLFCEYTREQLEQIAAAIEFEPEPLRTQLRHSFLLARYHGVRLRETQVNPMADVHLWQSARPGAVNGLEGSIRFHQKGGKVMDKPLHPKLIPLFADLQARKQTFTYPPTQWGNRWFKFLTRAGLKAQNATACFHSLRVTVKNQLDAAGVPTEIVREYLSHTPQDVHSSYGRFENLDKMRVCHGALG